MENMSEFHALKPQGKPRIMDLVSEAGMDVSDWFKSAADKSKVSANPKYCYEWCFFKDQLLILNIWFENLKVLEKDIFQKLNMRGNERGLRKMRARRFDDAVRYAYEIGLNPRVIILDRSNKSGSAVRRKLDRMPWTVTNYNYSSGDFSLCRGIKNSNVISDADLDLLYFKEGEARWRFIKHRRRESKLRFLKIEQNRRKNSGRILCEVPGCGFDFFANYGPVGEGYCQVHHLVPLSQIDDEGVGNSVDDLAVVCANCHVMIHRGGECRPLNNLLVSHITAKK